MRAAATTRRDWLGVESMGDLSILRGLVRCDARPGVVDLCAGCEGSRVLDRGRRMWGDDSSVGWFNSLSSDSGALACGGLLEGGVGGVLTAAPDASHAAARREMSQWIGHFEARTFG